VDQDELELRLPRRLGAGPAKYGLVAQHPHALEVLRQAVEETVAVARTSGIDLPDAKLVEVAFRLGKR
jgi:ketopantoate reductase